MKADSRPRPIQLPPIPGATVLERHYDDGQSRFDVSVDHASRTTLVVTGKTTMNGLTAMLSCMDEAVATLKPGDTGRFYIDIRSNGGGPRRGQKLFEKWLARNSERFERGVIVGGRNHGRSIAGSALRDLRLRNLRFFNKPQQAKSWLDDS